MFMIFFRFKIAPFFLHQAGTSKETTDVCVTSNFTPQKQELYDHKHMGPRHSNERTIDQAQFRKTFKQAQLRKCQGYYLYTDTNKILYKHFKVETQLGPKHGRYTVQEISTY